MRILVCTDGSEQSKKAMEEAAKIAGGCNVDNVSVIHVYDEKFRIPVWGEEQNITREDIERFKKLEEDRKEERKKILTAAVDFFKEKGISAKGIFKEGHPAETITRAAKEEEVDMLVVGSRGLGGLKKLWLGSVSNALLQETGANVLVVKK